LAVVSGAVALAIGFGAHITVEQMGLIMAFSAAVLGVITRQSVYSPASVEKMVPPPVPPPPGP
jgi:hypothetical protein